MGSNTISANTDKIRQKALEAGFFKCGFSKAGELADDAGFLKSWLKEKRHAGMGYMENHFEKRTDPQQLYEGTRSVIVVLYNYTPDEEPEQDRYKIARYAYGVDYHFVMKQKLKELIAYIQTLDPEASARAFVDSAPVLERRWAQKAGLGWIGKNTNFITKEKGSYFFIGEILTSLELEYDQPFLANHCGGCTRCLEACPTQALDEKGLDSGKCISYWTIEYRGDNLPLELSGKFENWVFGCDICQEVCPWNRLASPHSEPAFRLSDRLKKKTPGEWENMTKETFNASFRDSPVKRTGFIGLKRNIRFVKNGKGES